jgi:broad specificity phosphatase PhoE
MIEVKLVQILIIRHGESEEDTVNVHEPLTNRGIEQGEKMSMRVSEDFPPEFITCKQNGRYLRVYRRLSSRIPG